MILLVKLIQIREYFIMEIFKPFFSKKEKPQTKEDVKTPEKIEDGDFEKFTQKEREVIERATGVLNGLVPDKYKKKATAILAAFSLFAGASSEVFAGDSEKNITDRNKLFPSGQSETFRNFSDKLEIVVSRQTEKTSNYNPVVIEGGVQEMNEVAGAFSESIYKSKNAEDFFKNLDTVGENLNDVQKAMFLKKVSELLGRTYNYDMMENSETVEISDDKMFGAMKNLYTMNKIEETGICGNISTFIVKSANKLGLEAWLQSGSYKGTNDIFSGMVVDGGGQKQIAFLTYWGDLIPTGTLNYKEALTRWEQYAGSVATFNSYVANENEVLFPVKSQAQEAIEKAAGFEDVGGKLGKELGEGRVEAPENTVKIEIGSQSESLKVNKDIFTVAYSKSQAGSLEEMDALRFGLKHKTEQLGIEADATYVNMEIGDLFGKDSVVRDEVIMRLAADYINSQKFNKSEFGRFMLNFGATFQSGLKLPLSEDWGAMSVTAMGEGAVGAKLIYFNPGETAKLYIGALETLRAQSNDFQNQDLIIKEAARTLTIGSELKVNQVALANLEASFSKFDYGKGVELKGGLVGDKWSGEIGYGKISSEYERYIPSEEKISAGVGYKAQRWEIDILGNKITEKYDDAESKDKYGGEVKIKIFFDKI